MRLIDGDYLLYGMGMFSERENGAEFMNGVNAVAKMIEKSETVHDHPDWTPCAEGLPTEAQEVLFETALQVPATDYFGTYKGFYSDGIFWIDNVMHEKKFGISKQSVIAWQPLPAPYRADDTTGKVKEGVDNGN